ncbi:WD40 repeat domain-containing serine/threonine protein kinase [Paenibacillus albus]|uniref:WD40 repeat domain-containing serine/threonine protein kinase n=1 Tax=Paenibacillus albus TaxID=2495582 RepID=UPI0013DFA2BC|nr:WD40 repeat domain-containing serine/threonine protein kinase [Paenibacillus albus]
MSQVIAGAYEVIREIGSGGGGIVYLARHLRLDKQVVLKVDRRKLLAKPEALRREVDALKNLSHTYIPQVYDFVIENESVYTVMDYIEGESFDKPLKNGVRFTQPQVVHWACQLLEALSYLHSRPPHGILHADIKPANVMLTSQGDIRLIDYNIALALGEEGAVAIGRSLGYASPEHLGLGFSYSSESVPTHSRGDVRATTVLDSPDTVVSTNTPPPSSSSGKKIMLDVRSDIYGLGATLYHILTGSRPAHRVHEVVPLSDKDYSRGLVTIINKAMDPNPDLRYQSATEMLHAFQHLRENDPRVKRHKRMRMMTAIICIAVLMFGAFSTVMGLKRMQSEQASLKLAEYSANAMADGDSVKAVQYALDALPTPGIFTSNYTPQAQNALANALGVYDLEDGFKPHKVLELPSETLKTVLSPNGKTAAAITLGELTIYDTETAGVIATLPSMDSALSDVEFINNNRLVFAGKEGICLYDISQKQKVWTGKPATEIAVSADGSSIAAIYKDEGHATVYNGNGKVASEINFEGKKQRIAVNDSFANPNDNLLALSANGEWLAVSFGNGALSLFNVKDPNGTVELYDKSEFFHFEGGFSGNFFAFSSTGAKSSVFGVIDMHSLAQTGGFESKNPFGVIANESGIYISNENKVVRINPISGEQVELAYTAADVASFAIGKEGTLVGLKNNSFAFYDSDARLTMQFKGAFKADFVGMNGDYAIVGNRNTPNIRVLKQEHNPSIFDYDSSYVHDEARLNANGSTVMLFSLEQFRLYAIDGKLLKEVKLPETEQIYDQQYKRDKKGSRLEVIYNDGHTDIYSGDTGELVGTEQREQPDLSLYEQFFTDTLKIASPLEGAPVAYDRKSGKKIKELEKDAYLTYVTQVGNNVITEYVSTDGERYGLLLDGKTCETLAYLPNLCDIIGDRLLFDMTSGQLRETHLHATSELIAQMTP